MDFSLRSLTCWSWYARHAWVAWLALCSAALADDVFFYDQVVPIFQRRCIGCHSDSEPKGDFSVESAAGALKSGLIEPGDVQASRIVEVITPVDGKAEMPKDAEAMTSQEIGTIRKWVEQGAVWPTGVSVAPAAVEDFDWWSLRPLQRPDVPPIVDQAAAGNPIDHFIQAKLAQQGLEPTPEADRWTLVRRLYFDLLGLPPTPEQVQAFVDDPSPQAYENLVDELLASEHYGERWARHWLDVVHYADTHGYDKDKMRPNAWPYRDYVIRAFNSDKSYSQFIREQLAGDVLWPYSMDGVTATGFIAAGPWDFIGHAEVPESKIDGRIARHLDRDDMVGSTMNTFLSTTVQCARCHNHKFDPLTQEHYYSLQAVFAALDRADRPYDRDPQVAQQRESLQRRQRQVQSELEDVEAAITRLGGEQLAEFQQQIKALEEQSKTGAAAEFGYHSQFAEEQDTPKWVQIDLGASTAIDRIELIGAHDDFGGIGAGFGFPLRYKIEASDDADFESNMTVVADQTAHDVENPGTQPTSIACKPGVQARYWRMTATKLFFRKDTHIFALGEFRAIDESGNNVALKAQVTSLDSIEAAPRWQRVNLVDGRYWGQETHDRSAALAELKGKRDAFLKQLVPLEMQDRRAGLETERSQIETALGQLLEPGQVYAGTIHHGSGAFKGTGGNGGKPRTIHVLHRGNILQPRGEATPGRIPLQAEDDWKFDLADEHTEGDRRVALANWIADPQNSLTWRSIVNRVWQYHFGRGIVDTPNDFGHMGAQPTHPELLDWLAVEFRDSGQSFKKLHKLIVTSAAYRRTAHHHADNAVIDNENQFLWRMNRRRLSAEEIRDAVLSVTGTLDRKMYGPAVKLFVVERPEHSPHYEYYKHDPNDPASHRRSVYRFIVRSQPDPFMTTFDCADSSQSVPKRIETVTPLQALSLLNNKFMLSMSEHFADHLLAEQSSTAGQVQLAFQRTTGRMPTDRQQEALVAYAEEFGLANTCRLMLNLNEFVFVD